MLVVVAVAGFVSVSVTDLVESLIIDFDFIFDWFFWENDGMWVPSPPLELSTRMVSLLTWAPDMLAEGAIGIKQTNLNSRKPASTGRFRGVHLVWIPSYSNCTVPSLRCQQPRTRFCRHNVHLPHPSTQLSQLEVFMYETFSATHKRLITEP